MGKSPFRKNVDEAKNNTGTVNKNAFQKQRVGNPGLRLLSHFVWGFGLSALVYGFFVYRDISNRNDDMDNKFEEWTKKQQELDKYRKQQGLEISAEKKHMIDEKFNSLCTKLELLKRYKNYYSI